MRCLVGSVPTTFLIQSFKRRAGAVHGRAYPAPAWTPRRPAPRWPAGAARAHVTNAGMQLALNTAAAQDVPSAVASPRRTPREKKDAYQAEINAMEAKMKEMATNLRSLEDRRSSPDVEVEERGACHPLC